MTFSLPNVASTFQHFINEVMRDLDFVYNYIDDILIASASSEEHATHLHLLFKRFQQYQMKIKPGKCVFDASSLIFLGHNISPEGISLLQDEILPWFEKTKRKKRRKEKKTEVNTSSSQLKMKS